MKIRKDKYLPEPTLAAPDGRRRSRSVAGVWKIQQLLCEFQNIVRKYTEQFNEMPLLAEENPGYCGIGKDRCTG